MRDAVLNLSEAIANELMSQNMLDVPVFAATPVIAIVLREAHLPELVEAGDAMKRGYGHSHWDHTMCHGAGCELCIEQRKLSAAWNAAKAAFLKGAEK